MLQQRDTYFHVQRGRLKLREVRREGAPPQTELIQYLRPDDPDARASDYLVVSVTDPEALREALARALGVRVVVAKRRELYLWRHTRIHLDVVERLGAFVELETVVTDPSFSADARAELAQGAAALGICDPDRVAVSYADLLEDALPRRLHPPGHDGYTKSGRGKRPCP